jgi:hypothetical protein
MGDKVYKTVIPRNVRVSEAPSHGKPALLYDLKCAGSQAYLRLAARSSSAKPCCGQPKEIGMALEQRKRLGRGLDALLGGFPAEPDLQRAVEARDKLRRWR